MDADEPAAGSNVSRGYCAGCVPPGLAHRVLAAWQHEGAQRAHALDTESINQKDLATPNRAVPAIAIAIAIACKGQDRTIKPMLGPHR